MGEGHQQQHIYSEPQKLLLPQNGSGSSRRRIAGEIVQVQGGHIMRSMGRKDRHSKVCTAKGPRDRRVRLSAHTAIQFYDVQDRLGFDRPSKAVDWLIRNAKAAIDELAELPPWQPTSATVTDASDVPPTSLQSDAIGSTVKSSFFPAADYAHAEDLRLSLQSFHNDGVPLHHRGNGEALFSDSTTTLMFEQNQKMVRCMPAMGGEGSGGTGGFGFSVPPPPSQPPEVGAIQMHQLLGQSSFLAQRGTLQSSSSPLARSWMEAIGHPSQTLPMGGRSLGGSFSSFRVPARIGGEEENGGGISDLPSAASR